MGTLSVKEATQINNLAVAIAEAYAAVKEAEFGIRILQDLRTADPNVEGKREETLARAKNRLNLANTHYNRAVHDLTTILAALCAEDFVTSTLNGWLGASPTSEQNS